MTSDIFSNLPVSLAQQPPLEQLSWQGLSPRYLRLNVLLYSGSTVLFSLLWLALFWQPWWPLSESLSPLVLWGGIAFSVYGLWRSVYCYLAFSRKAYALRQHDLSFRSGLLFERCVTQPILRIQHIEIKRGPLERQTGLASLQVFSAGGAMHTFQIPGLPLEQAEAIRQLILQHKDGLVHE